MNTSEQDARIKINELLKNSNWDLNDKFQVRTEVIISYPDSVNEKYHTENEKYQTDSQYMITDNSKTGFADYVLYNSSGKPLAVIEAKKEAFEPYRAKQQVLPYAKSIDAPFIYLTNGDVIYFWDYINDDARIINSFHSQRDLERIIHLRTTKKPLAEIIIPDFYIRKGETRELRDYQKETMRALDYSLELGKRKFLLELPTGTGKTDIICLYVKRLIEASKTERVLFLVDREQLAKQAIDAFQDLLPQYSSYWMKSSIEKHEKQITVCLLQTMISRFDDFTSGYFDLVIADECHRSIYGSWQTALTHFDAIHIGLTATPSEYIERNTFEFYNCKNGKPDFSYRIQDAFYNRYLAPYTFAENITKIMAEGANKDDEHYDPIEFERKWTNEKTNKLMMSEFENIAREKYLELAPLQKEAPGKTIVFAITKNHATRLAKILNDFHPDLKGKYAEVITSDVVNANELIRQFKYEKYPMVVVSVDMLTTGFDCPELLHLVLCRRVRSPILYQQIRGRGTRTCKNIDKKRFMIYDFFENHKYFNDDETNIFTGGQGYGGGGVPSEPPRPKELKELGLEDEWLYSVHYIEVGPEGERVDKKEYITNWEKTIKESSLNDPIIQKIIKLDAAKTDEEKKKFYLTEEEEKKLTEKLNQPNLYFNEDNLRKAYQKPGGVFIDFIKNVFHVAKLKTKDEEITENFNAWLITKSFSPEQAQYLSLLKNRGIAKGKIEIDDLFKPPLSILNTANTGIELFGEEGLKQILNEINETVLKHKVA